MNKLLKIMHMCGSILTNTLVLGGIIIVLLWILGGIPPQTSISKTAYFFSNAWYLITGAKTDKMESPNVSETSLRKATSHIRTINQE